MKIGMFLAALLALCNWTFVMSGKAMAHGGTDLGAVHCDCEDDGEEGDKSERTFDCEDEDGDKERATFDCEDEDGDDGKAVLECHDDDGGDEK